MKIKNKNLFILACGIIGTILFPLIVFSILSLVKGTFSIESLIIISKMVFGLDLFLIYLYLSGFFMGIVIGYITQTNFSSFFKKNLWILMALLGFLFGSLYPWFFMGSSNSSPNKYGGFSFFFVLIFGPPICLITGAIIGKMIGYAIKRTSK